MIVSLPVTTRGFPRLILLAAACVPFAAVAQTSAERAPANPLAVFPFDRATAPIDDGDSIALRGHVHPMAVPANDAGPVPGTFAMNRMILTLTPSADQQSAEEAYAAALQDPRSPFFHRWLTPAEFGTHFGLSQNDLDRISGWLRDRGFTIDEIPAGHWSITFSGTAAQVENAFHTTMRFYNVAGEIHRGNANDPQIPRALSGIVSGVSGLDDFRPRRVVTTPPEPHGLGSGGHYLDPSDFATIYDVNPLYDKGIKGNGITIAVIETCTTDFSVLALAQTFWNLVGVPQNSNAIWNYGTPAICGAKDYDEVFLDYEWAGAVAPQATVWLVSSDASDSLLGAVQGVVEHGVNNGFAHVITMSYQDCESAYNLSAWVPIWLQAHIQGITALVSSGDIGAAACDFPGDTTTATHGRAVNGFCASPYVVCVGGTQFNDVANPGQYWSAAGQALGYIPETAWNESGTLGKTPTTWGSSGGGYSTIQPKPSWQTGNTNTQRGEPDVSLTSAAHDPYRTCLDPNSPCVPSSFFISYGTSAAAPSFAGIMALVIQATGQSQGSPNQTLYGLAAQPGLGVFHDIVSGDNSVNGVPGYTAAPGWDAVTGLGSVDANALVSNWPGSQVSGAVLVLSTGQLTFGNQAVNTASTAQAITITNRGSGFLNFSASSIGGANSTDFTDVSTCGTSVAAGASCTISVAFKPTATGARSATLTITDNAPGSPHTVALSGTGVSSGASFNRQRVTTTAPPASGCVVPPSVSAFATTDRTVYLYFEATVTPADNLTLKWLAPNGDVIDGGGWQAEVGTYCYNEQLDISNPKAGHFGPWQAVVSDNGAQLFAVAFTVSASGTPSGSALQFQPVAPCRIMDTRNSNGAFGGPFVGGGTSRTVAVPSSACGVPANASAYSLNFTVVPRGRALGSLVAWPTGLARPLVSTLTSSDGSILANAALVQAGNAGSIDLYATDDTDVIIDINGYFVPPAAGTLQFYPLPPCRVLDTRNANGTFGGPSLAGNSRSFPVASGPCGAPSAAAAYSLNVTVVPKGPLAYLTAWPTGQPQPFVSTLNSFDGTVIANAAIVPAGTGGAASFFASNATDVVVDINGYFAPPGSGGLNFYTLAPCRVADTRNTNGTFGGPAMSAATTRSFPLGGQCGLPTYPTGQAYSLSITVIPRGVLGYLSIWPTGAAPPVVSTLNAWKGQAVANAALVPAGTGSSIDVYVTDPTDVIIDTAGYFGP